MDINAADMVSASDVSDDSGRLIALAAGGRRLVVMNNHEPIAAMIGIDDLHRLVALDDTKDHSPADLSADAQRRSR